LLARTSCTLEELGPVPLASYLPLKKERLRGAVELR
jgi:hypothetical protein